MVIAVPQSKQSGSLAHQILIRNSFLAPPIHEPLRCSIRNLFQLDGESLKRVCQNLRTREIRRNEFRRFETSRR